MYKYSRLMALCCALLITAWLTPAAVAADTSTPPLDPLSSSFHLFQQAEALRQQAHQAILGQEQQRSEIQHFLQRLQAPLPDNAVVQAQQQIEYYEQLLVSTQRKLKLEQQWLELIKNPTPQARTQKAQDLHQALQQLQIDIAKQREPHNRQLRQLYQEHLSEGQDLAQALRPFAIEQPSGIYQDLQLAPLSANILNAFIAMEWKDKQGQKQAWAHLRIRTPPKSPSSARRLQERYVINNASAKGVWLWLGSFYTYFELSHPAWQQEAQVLEALPLFLKLDELAAVSLKTP